MYAAAMRERIDITIKRVRFSCVNNKALGKSLRYKEIRYV